MNETELSKLLDLTASRITRQTKSNWARAELTPARRSVLSVLIQKGSMSVTQLAGIEGVRVPTMTNLVKSLEKNAYIIRRVDKQDGRVRRIQITRRGRTAYRAHFHEKNGSLSSVVAKLTARERRTIQRAAVILREKLGIDS